jgi:hypothetical protein
MLHPESDSEFANLLSGAPKDRLVVVDFYADWCGKKLYLELLVRVRSLPNDCSCIRKLGQFLQTRHFHQSKHRQIEGRKKVIL